MAPKAPTREIGTATLAMKVAGMLLRKTKITATTRATARTSSNSTSCTEARMPVVRSLVTATLTPAGRPCSRSGRLALILSTVAMTLAPGWRCTFSTTAGVVFIHAPSWVFSAPDTAVATSFSRIGAPPL